MKLAKRFEMLGDPAAFAMEFEREAREVLAEADRRLALGRSTKALREARERAERKGLAPVQRSSGASALERWGSLASAVHWVEQLERQMESGTKRARGAHTGPSPSASPEVSDPGTALTLHAFPGKVALEFDTPGHRAVLDLVPEDARTVGVDLIVASVDAERMERTEPQRLH